MGARLPEPASDNALEESCLYLYDVIILRYFFERAFDSRVDGGFFFFWRPPALGRQID